VHFSAVVADSAAAEVEVLLAVGLSGERFRRPEEVNGRKRRVKNGGAEEAMSRMRRARRSEKWRDSLG
jgi:hypothetical protein